MFISLFPGYYGKTNIERLEIDQIVYLLSDLIQELYKFFFETDQVKKVPTCLPMCLSVCLSVHLPILPSMQTYTCIKHIHTTNIRSHIQSMHIYVEHTQICTYTHPYLISYSLKCVFTYMLANTSTHIILVWTNTHIHISILLLVSGSFMYVVYLYVHMCVYVRVCVVWCVCVRARARCSISVSHCW